jgi:hypothetical protein
VRLTAGRGQPRPTPCTQMRHLLKCMMYDKLTMMMGAGDRWETAGPPPTECQ